MKKIYNLFILIVYILLLINMMIKFLPNIIAVAISLIILIPAIHDRLKSGHNKGF